MSYFKSLNNFHIMFIKTFLFLFSALLVVPILSQENSASVKILWMGGDNSSHNVSAQRDEFVPVLTDSGFSVTYREDINEVFVKDTLDNYDILMVWTGLKGAQAGLPNLTQQQDDDLVEWVEAGNAFLAIHAASSAWIQNEGYINLIGATWTEHGPGLADVQPIESEHPAVEGLEPYPFDDEGRLHDFLKDDLDTLMWALEETLLVPWTWVRTQGEGRIYYTAGGHDLGSISTPEFQKQLIQAMRWLHPLETDTVPEDTSTSIQKRNPSQLSKKLIFKSKAEMNWYLGMANTLVRLYDTQGKNIFSGETDNYGILKLTPKPAPGKYVYKVALSNKSVESGTIQILGN